MRNIKLGKTGIDISKMGLGTWSIGGGSAWGGDHDLQTVVDTICEAPKVGINLIDTAPGYNFGNSEKIVGMALKQMKREDVTIITKCGITWDQEMKGSLFNVVNGIQLYKNLNSASIRREIEASLERLGTDYIDVYMTHWQSVEDEYYVPIEKTMEVLNDLKAQGKIRAIGAANVDIHHIEEYLKWGDLDIVQAKYSVLDRAVEDDIVPCCKENGITLQAYSPLEMGLLSGKMPRDYKPVGAQIRKHAEGHGHNGCMEAADGEIQLLDREPGPGMGARTGRVHHPAVRRHFSGPDPGERAFRRTGAGSGRCGDDA